MGIIATREKAMKYAAIATCILVACAGMAKAEIVSTVKWAPVVQSPLWDRNGVPKWKPEPTQAVKTIWESPALRSNPKSSSAPRTASIPNKPSAPILHPERRHAFVLPPKEYDRPYTAGPLVIETVNSQDEVRRRCSTATFSHGYALACTTRYTGSRCVIVIANENVLRSEGFTTTVVRRHEEAHCYGWPGTHPNSRQITEADWKQP